ncbi:MAG TPA: hypothetical protein VK034_26760 [Enhygromyxa sp.]|nr:hypothetical protein [Enhygromyxa sp.]
MCLIAVRDGDAVGVEGRKVELDEALRQAGLAPRGPTERIATPVPTWAIENWLLDLLEHPNINENRRPSGDSGPTWKQVFERVHGTDENLALTTAAQAWPSASVRLPSLRDGRAEIGRIDE